MKQNKKSIAKAIAPLFFFLLSILFFASCQDELTPVEFFKKVSEDKDYKKEQEIGDYVLTCQYRPSELICLKELEKNLGDINRVSKKQFEEESKKYKNGCYMDVSVSLKNGENVMIQGLANQGQYAARLGELTYLLTNSCYLLVDDKDSVKAMDCLFSNTYGNSPTTRFMMVFPSTQLTTAKKSIALIYADRTFGIPEKASFIYDPETLQKQLPTIKEQKK
jgi:hypothetical protein